MSGGTKRALHRLRYFASDAWEEWRHSPGVNLLALGTLAAALFLAGLAVLVIYNVDRRVQHLREDVRVDVYLTDGHDDEQRQALLERLAAIEGVVRVEFVTKDEALRRYRAWASDLAELVNEMESNPLPASLEVFLQPGPRAAEIAAGISAGLEQSPEVEEVRFNRERVERLDSLLGMARTGGTGLALLVFAAVAFVMASVLRLAVYARREEIEIMHLVGATTAFIRGPFLVAGLVQGLLASLLALGTVEGVRRAVLSYTAAGSVALLDLLAARALPLGLDALLVLVGLAVSLVGSYLAVRQSL